MRLEYFYSQAPLPKDKILQLIRLWLEHNNHDHVLGAFCTDTSYKPCAINAIGESCLNKFHSFHEDVSAMEGWTAEAMCNKTVPIYVTASGSTHPSREFERYIAQSLFFWLYRRWFRPYRSNIEFGRFIAHAIHPADLPPDAEPGTMAQHIVSMHKAICSQVESMAGRPKFTPCWIPCDNRAVYCDPRVYIMQPIFQALIIIFPSQNCSLFNTDFSTISVFLVLTGITKGLSEPITFESLDTKVEYRWFSDTLVQLSLEDAVAFVEKIEMREVAAYGQCPDITTMGQDLYQYHLKLKGGGEIIDHMIRLGWEGEPRLESPSSEWVWNPKEYPDLAWNYYGWWRDQWKSLLLRSHREYIEALINDQELVWHRLQ